MENQKKNSFPSDHWHLFAEQFGARKTYKAVRQDAFRSNEVITFAGYSKIQDRSICFIPIVNHQFQKKHSSRF